MTLDPRDLITLDELYGDMEFHEPTYADYLAELTMTDTYATLEEAEMAWLSEMERKHMCPHCDGFHSAPGYGVRCLVATGVSAW